MYEQIKEVVSSLINLNEVELNYFISKLQVKHFNRKEIILQEGQICRYAYFINRGCIRYFHNLEGEEITAQFFFENGWYTDYGSYLSGTASTQNIQAIEKTEILLLSKTDLYNLYQTIPQFEKLGRLMAERAFLGLRQRTEMLTNQTPEERYLNLIKDRPKVFERVPQHYIASYLGIKAPSLSRIRKRIFDKK